MQENPQLAPVTMCPPDCSASSLSQGLSVSNARALLVECVQVMHRCTVCAARLRFVDVFLLLHGRVPARRFHCHRFSHQVSCVDSTAPAAAVPASSPTWCRPKPGIRPSLTLLLFSFCLHCVLLSPLFLTKSNCACFLLVVPALKSMVQRPLRQ